MATLRVGFFFSSRRRHTRLQGDWSSDVCSSDLDRGAVGEPAGRVVYRVEGAEALVADRDRRRGALGAAVAAAEWPRGDGDGSKRSRCDRHERLKQKSPGNNAAGGRFLAPCLTWRQYAANHHVTSIVARKIPGDLVRSSRGTACRAPTSTPTPGPARARTRE